MSVAKHFLKFLAFIVAIDTQRSKPSDANKRQCNPQGYIACVTCLQAGDYVRGWRKWGGNIHHQLKAHISNANELYSNFIGHRWPGPRALYQEKSL